MFTRRDFIRAGLVSTAAGVIVPPALAKGVLAAAGDGVHNDHVLVVLQLGGGNDGLNTVIPYADGAYHDSRPNVGVSPDTVLKLSSAVGLHPALPGIKALYDQGIVAIVQGVGYDQPTYSHFEGAHVWQFADPARRQTDGWLGRLLATPQMTAATASAPLAACALGEASEPQELRTATAVSVSVINSLPSYAIQGGQGRTVAATNLYRSTPGVYGMLFDSASSTAQAGIAALKSAGSTYKPAASYEPKGVVYGSKVDLASAMQLAAQVIITQPSAKVIHVVLGGWDTHQQQDTRQQALLAYLDSAVSALFQDLKAHGADHRVTLFTWSEFGRRVKENGSKGTDHGAAAPMFVVGGALHGGLLGQQPSLTNTIDSGNLKYSVDFRSVYQSLIRDWLGGDSAAALGGTFPDSGLRWAS